MEFTAVFPLVSRAVDFAKRITEPGWYAENVTQKGRTVTFTTPADRADSDTFSDYLDAVGYYGSDIERKATLNGVKAPISY